MACKFSGDERRFAEHYGLGYDEKGKYTCEGGGYPVFVKGVEGVVASIVVAGLDGEQAHGLIVKAVDEYKELRADFKSPMRSMTMR